MRLNWRPREAKAILPRSEEGAALDAKVVQWTSSTFRFLWLPKRAALAEHRSTATLSVAADQFGVLGGFIAVFVVDTDDDAVRGLD